MSDIGQAQRRSDFLTFSANSDRAQLCFQHVDDLIPCERDIVGTVRLNNNSGVALGQPATAEITIQDDDCEQFTITAHQTINALLLSYSYQCQF